MPHRLHHTGSAVRRLCTLSLLTALGIACSPSSPPSSLPLAAPAVAAAGVAAPASATPTATATPEEFRFLTAPLAPAATPAPTETPDFLPRRMPTSTPTPAATRRPALPTATRPAHVRELRVPVLMYHYISTPPPDADRIRLDLSVTPERFEEQVAYLAGQGYQSVSLQAVYDAVTGGKPLPPKPIVLTFDDGYADAYDNAMPILRRHNFSGTFYIVTGFVGRKGYLTAEQILEMAQAGMELEAHSVTHIPMRNKPADVLRAEMLGSKQALEQLTGKPVNFFCYPSGQYDTLAIQILQASGYLSATTTKPGAWQNEALPYEWPRIRMRGADQLPDFIKRINYPEG